jgi:hypothetical protein
MDEYNMDFWELYYRLLHYHLSAREMNYLIWKFYNKKCWREIARLDGRIIGRQAVSKVICDGYRKIRGDI